MLMFIVAVAVFNILARLSLGVNDNATAIRDSAHSRTESRGHHCRV